MTICWLSFLGRSLFICHVWMLRRCLCNRKSLRLFLWCICPFKPRNMPLVSSPLNLGLLLWLLSHSPWPFRSRCCYLRVRLDHWWRCFSRLFLQLRTLHYRLHLLCLRRWHILYSRLQRLHLGLRRRHSVMETSNWRRDIGDYLRSRSGSWVRPKDRSRSRSGSGSWSWRFQTLSVNLLHVRRSNRIRRQSRTLRL